MKKFNKIITLVLVAAMVLSMVSCKKDDEKPEGTKTETKTEQSTTKTEEEPDVDEGYEIALITDVGTIDDKSFNQGAWEGVVAYAEANSITHKYYKPTEKSDDAYLASIELAVEGGAKTIVCPGFLFEPAVFQAQTTYPEVKFIILDGYPHAGDWVPVINDNVLAIFYAEQEAGFLAGYAAVKDGYRQLAFTGGIAVPAVIKFGYGYIQGADLAAEELGLGAGAVNVKYTYFGNFDASPDNMAKASALYNEGTEVIFACGGSAGNSVMKAAETAGKKVIGVDVDQYAESDTVITSSMKNLKKSVVDALTAIYAGTFEGGQQITLDATVEGVGLPMANSRFATFSDADYDAIYARIVAKEITIKGDADAASAKELETERVKVQVIE